MPSVKKQGLTSADFYKLGGASPQKLDESEQRGQTCQYATFTDDTTDEIVGGLWRTPACGEPAAWVFRKSTPYAVFYCDNHKKKIEKGKSSKCNTRKPRRKK